MTNKRFRGWIYVCFFVLIVISLVIPSIKLSSHISTPVPFTNFTLKTSSDSLFINNNSELQAFATSGNGTASNPYIIENRTINGKGGVFGILINNSDSHFVLRNCSIINASYGIYLNNVTNGSIENNRVNDCTSTGLYLSNSLVITAKNNTIYNCDIAAVTLNHSISNNFYSNDIFNNAYAGFYLVDSNYIVLMANHVYENKIGILLIRSNYTLLIRNYGIGNTINIKEEGCIGNSFIENFIYTLKDFIFLDFTFILILCECVLVSYFVIKNVLSFDFIKKR